MDDEIISGWVRIKNDWYYFHPDGHMAYGGWIKDHTGRACCLDDTGKWIPENLTWIGDSLSAYENGYTGIQNDFYIERIDSFEAKQSKRILEDQEDNPAGLTIARQLADEGKISEYLVFQLGTNGDEDPDGEQLTTQEKIERLVSITASTGQDIKILLVTVFFLDPEATELLYDEVNDGFRYMAEQNPDIAVADWAEVCDPETDLVDNVHQTPAGGVKFADLIRDTIVENFGAH
mgnify:CR=1 FL=1